MGQLELFDYRPDRHDFDQGSIYAALAGSCRLFYRRSEVASICRTTYSVVRQAIEKMQLDALLIDGEYRIPGICIRDWISDMERLADIQEAYDGWMLSRTIPGAFSLSTLYRNGCISREKALMRLSGSCGRFMAEMILATDMSRYDVGAAVEERFPFDWYGLDRLELPPEADVPFWAGVLEVEPRVLARLGRWRMDEVVDRGDFKAFLVEREVVNLPVFRTIRPQPDDEDEGLDGQPLLF